jgi:hypothetical protein
MKDTETPTITYNQWTLIKLSYDDNHIVCFNELYRGTKEECEKYSYENYTDEEREQEKIKVVTFSSRITTGIFINLPSNPENYNHPKTGRQNYIHAIAYETDQLNRCASAVIQEIINLYAYDGLIKVEDLLKLIGELK